MTDQQAAEKYADMDVGVDLEKAFLAGAAHKERQILEWLRSEEDNKSVPRTGTFKASLFLAADWIEKKLGAER